jgi:hypothetical protein
LRELLAIRGRMRHGPAAPAAREGGGRCHGPPVQVPAAARPAIRTPDATAWRRSGGHPEPGVAEAAAPRPRRCLPRHRFPRAPRLGHPAHPVRRAEFRQGPLAPGTRSQGPRGQPIRGPMTARARMLRPHPAAPEGGAADPRAAARTGLRPFLPIAQSGRRPPPRGPSGARRAAAPRSSIPNDETHADRRIPRGRDPRGGAGRE